MSNRFVSGQASAPVLRKHVSRKFEFPTLAVVVVIYAAFGALTWFHGALAWWVLLPAGTFLVAWHGSLQHEVVHGHPTPFAWLNEALVLPSLWLWIPFRLYRESHLAHHNDDSLTDPLDDPESFYLTAEAWATAGPFVRTFLWVQNSLAGRLLLGPLRCFWLLYGAEGKRLLRGDFSHAKAWALHGLGVVLVLTWVLAVCGLPLWQYLLFFVYPGIGLTLLRSFLEHRAEPVPTHRSAIVEAGPLMSLLFLNNNLHIVHHAKPGLPWYRIPALYREQRALFQAANGGYVFSGYGTIFRRYFFRAKEAPVHPGTA
ncbi:fatty acid desaturase [Pelagibius litoralis]|uniref:Fatty acid desaturase n=1 Tax=Pelagibius litoralis TaxID=374515 RepID=A0A967C5L8_9PROT|nr:fatty acid desaturase [Pelagibius litoralis]NIA68970.1 fatty acid desaturase [Pelagibius litoralis]